MGGTAGRLPVAITKRRARIVASPASNRARIDETCAVADDGDTQGFEPALRIVRRDGRDRRVNVIVHALAVDLRLDARDAERIGMAHEMGGLGRGDHRLRRHAAGVEAVPAHLAAFDQHHLAAKLGGTGGDAQAAGARADHADVAFQRRHRIYSEARRLRKRCQITGTRLNKRQRHQRHDDLRLEDDGRDSARDRNRTVCPGRCRCRHRSRMPG